MGHPKQAFFVRGWTSRLLGEFLFGLSVIFNLEKCQRLFDVYIRTVPSRFQAVSAGPGGHTLLQFEPSDTLAGAVPGFDSDVRMNMQQERWLSVDEIAVHMGVNPDTVYKWIERRKLPAHKMGRLWKFKASEVDEWVKQGKAAEETPD